MIEIRWLISGDGSVYNMDGTVDVLDKVLQYRYKDDSLLPPPFDHVWSDWKEVETVEEGDAKDQYDLPIG